MRDTTGEGDGKKETLHEESTAEGASHGDTEKEAMLGKQWRDTTRKRGSRKEILHDKNAAGGRKDMG